MSPETEQQYKNQIAALYAEIEKLKQQIDDAKRKCDNATNYLSGKLGTFLELEDVPKKKATTQTRLEQKGY